MAYVRAFEEEKSEIFKNDFITPKSFYLYQIKKHWLKYSLGVLASFVTSLTEVLVPKFTQWFIDLTTSKNLDKIPQLFHADSLSSSLNLLLVGVCTVVFIGFWGRVFWRQFLARRTHETALLLRSMIWDRTRMFPMGVLRKFSLGDLINRSTTDVNSARFIHGFTLVITLDLIFFTILAVALMAKINLMLTLICLAVFPLLPLLISPLSKKEYKLYKKSQETLSRLSEGVYQSLMTIRMQRATSMGKNWEAKLKLDSKAYADENYQVVKTAWMIFPLGALPTIFAYAILLTFGINEIAKGELSVGAFIAFLSYVLMLQGPLFELSTAIAEWQKGFASLERITEIFNIRIPSKNDDKAVQNVENHSVQIQVQDLEFRYPGSKRDILCGLNFQLEKGQWIGFKGKVGAGKSTLISVLSGLEEHFSGQIHFQGNDIKFWKKDALAEKIVVVPQRSFLFSGSIRYNLCLDLEVSEEKLHHILQIVEFSKDLESMELGIDTWIGEWGMTLSGGQKQRLSLARSLLRAKSILLMDDCLSAVDAETEEKIIMNIKNHLAVDGVIWVAHRHSTLKMCDEIYTIEDGCIQLESK